MGYNTPSTPERAIGERPSAAERASAERPSSVIPGRGSIPPAANPSLLIPRPVAGAAPPTGSDRERVTQLEVQAQAMRAQMQRVEAESALSQKRVEAVEARLANALTRLEQVETLVAEQRTALTAKIDDALARADRPVSLQGVEERVERLDQLTTQVRAGLRASQQELSEHARLFESRKDRIDSLDTRLGRIESDARIADIRRGIEALDLRMSAIDAGRDAAFLPIAQRLAALEAKVAEAAASSTAKAETPARGGTKKTKKPAEPAAAEPDAPASPSPRRSRRGSSS